MSGGGSTLLAFSPPPSRPQVVAAGGSGGTRAAPVASRARLPRPDLGRAREILSFGFETSLAPVGDFPGRLLRAGCAELVLIGLVVEWRLR